MRDLGHDWGEVLLVAGADALGPLVEAAGWTISSRAAEIRLIDARAGTASVVQEDERAADDRAALLAVVCDADEALNAYDAGATHVLVGDVDLKSMTLALRFAGRYARRLRGSSRARRAGETGGGAVRNFLAAHVDKMPATVAIIAITRFDAVNAAFGRAAGDLLLNQAGARIAAALPQTAVIERDDGARFVIAIDERDEIASARIVAIEAALARRFNLDAREASLGVRIGVAHRTVGEAPDALIRRARDAVDYALSSDGASVRVAPSLRAHGISLAADLHRAIDRDEIDILFQPQVAFTGGAVVGVEALARWEHPEHGVLGAETLFAAAERAGLGLALSEHIQTLALTLASRWTAPLAELRVAVNVTAADLARSDFVDSFLGIVRGSTIDPARVTVEVTESGFVTDLVEATARLNRLRQAGIRIAIDDFGTGYSSLAYLNALPLDYLKIDRSLTQDIAGGHRAGVVVRGIIAIAVGLGLTTIAEGVEEEEQRALLAAEGCDLYQGFLCAEPLDEVALAALIGTMKA